MNSEVRITGPKTKVFVTIGTSLTVALVLSMLIFPDVWRVGIYAIIGVMLLTAGVKAVEIGGDIVHRLSMQAIERQAARNSACFIQVAQTHNLYDARRGVVTVNAGLLQAPKDPGGKWITDTEVIDPVTNARKLLTIENIHPVKLKMFADSILAGAEFTQETAARFRISRPKFEAWCENLHRDGYLVWKHPSSRTQGQRLTDAGIAHITSLSSSPLPYLDGDDN